MALLPGAWLNAKESSSEFPYMALSFGILVLLTSALARSRFCTRLAIWLGVLLAALILHGEPPGVALRRRSWRVKRFAW